MPLPPLGTLPVISLANLWHGTFSGQTISISSKCKCGKYNNTLTDTQIEQKKMMLVLLNRYGTGSLPIDSALHLNSVRYVNFDFRRTTWQKAIACTSVRG